MGKPLLLANRSTPVRGRLRVATRADGQPAHAHRRTGYVTQAMIREHGSYAAALQALNKS